MNYYFAYYCNKQFMLILIPVYLFLLAQFNAFFNFEWLFTLYQIGSVLIYVLFTEISLLSVVLGLEVGSIVVSCKTGYCTCFLFQCKCLWKMFSVYELESRKNKFIHKKPTHNKIWYFVFNINSFAFLVFFFALSACL